MYKQSQNVKFVNVTNYKDVVPKQPSCCDNNLDALEWLLTVVNGKYLCKKRIIPFPNFYVHIF